MWFVLALGVVILHGGTEHLGLRILSFPRQTRLGTPLGTFRKALRQRRTWSGLRCWVPSIATKPVP